MKNSNKVQCISTKSGFYEHLKLGAWYEAKEYKDKFGYLVDTIAIEHHYLNKHGVYVTSEGIYDKSLFRTVSERRDNRLSKLLGYF
jgi:hypothetical protein